MLSAAMPPPPLRAEKDARALERASASLECAAACLRDAQPRAQYAAAARLRYALRAVAATCRSNYQSMFAIARYYAR